MYYSIEDYQNALKEAKDTIENLYEIIDSIADQWDEKRDNCQNFLTDISEMED